MFNTNFNHIQHIKPCYGLKPSCNAIWFQKQNFLSKSINVNESFQRGRKEKRTYPLHFFGGGEKTIGGTIFFGVIGSRFLAAGDGPLSFTRFLEPFLCFFFALELRSFTHRFQQVITRHTHTHQHG